MRFPPLLTIDHLLIEFNLSFGNFMGASGLKLNDTEASDRPQAERIR